MQKTKVKTATRRDCKTGKIIRATKVAKSHSGVRAKGSGAWVTWPAPERTSRGGPASATVSKTVRAVIRSTGSSLSPALKRLADK